jgi:hypothetical protein
MYTTFWSENLKGRPRRRWEDNIRMDLRKVGWVGVDWMHLARDCEHGNEHSGYIKDGECLH